MTFKEFMSVLAQFVLILIVVALLTAMVVGSWNLCLDRTLWYIPLALLCSGLQWIIIVWLTGAWWTNFRKY